MDGAHDLGGMHGLGAVVEPGGDEVFHAGWEARVFALHMLVSFERLGAGPGGRATREEMAPAEYLAASYYERWLWSAERRLTRAGTIAPGDVEAMMERLANGHAPPAHEDPAMAARAIAGLEEVVPLGEASAPRFAVGDTIRVRRMHPEGHTRCPRYARGAPGTIERFHGADRLPDRAVYGLETAPQPVYAVAFDSRDLWGAEAVPAFTVLLDLWESYLEPQEAPA